jgi:hypothetical protein
LKSCAEEDNFGSASVCDHGVCSELAPAPSVVRDLLLGLHRTTATVRIVEGLGVSLRWKQKQFKKKKKRKKKNKKQQKNKTKKPKPKKTKTVHAP